MNVIKETIVVYQLTLSESEATWLRAVVQNPLNGQSASEESAEDSDMRARFFYTLQKAK